MDPIYIASEELTRAEFQRRQTSALAADARHLVRCPAKLRKPRTSKAGANANRKKSSADESSSSSSESSSSDESSMGDDELIRECSERVVMPSLQAGDVIYAKGVSWTWLTDRRNYVSNELYKNRANVWVEGKILKIQPNQGTLSVVFAEVSKHRMHLTAQWFRDQALSSLPLGGHILSHSDYIRSIDAEDDNSTSSKSSANNSGRGNNKNNKRKQKSQQEQEEREGVIIAASSTQRSKKVASSRSSSSKNNNGNNNKERSINNKDNINNRKNKTK